VGQLVKDNDEFGYVYIVERDVPIWKSMQVSKVGGNLQGSCGGQQSGGCGNEKGVAFGNSGGTCKLTIVTRYYGMICNVVVVHVSCLKTW